MNYIWGLFLIIGIFYSFITGNIIEVNKELLDSGESAIEMILKLLPLTCLWLGVMKIAEDSGLLNILSIKLSPLLKYIFPEVKDNKTISFISSNIIMNMLGLGNAATPFGLKAMQELQKENTKKDTASRSMITFLVINTASVTIIPTTVISLRILNHSNNPTEILFCATITTILSCIFGLLIDRVFYILWRKKYD